MKDTKNEAKQEVTHDYTEVVNAAIKQHGSPFLKHLSKNRPFIKYFHYKEEGIEKVGFRAYRLGEMFVRGEVSDLFENLPEEFKTDLNASIMRDLQKQLQGEQVSSRMLILQNWNRQLQADINDAMEAAGHEPFIWEREVDLGRDEESSVFVKITYDGFQTPDALRERAVANMQRNRNARLMNANVSTARNAQQAITSVSGSDFS
jgi:hypothetical protein